MNKYSKLEKLFHKIVLGSKLIQEISFYLEKSFQGQKSEEFSKNPVFVLGLARSGTTTLLRLLHKTNKFESITYRDVPFVLMPNLWEKMSRYFHLHMRPEERAHGDTILVDFDSPESFEAIFWRTFSDQLYVKSKVMCQYQPGKEVIEKFKSYLGLVGNKSNAGKRHLSKNNNNLLRLPHLSDQITDGVFLVMWRNPLQTAYSLFKMNERFTVSQKEDPFVLEYMNLIGHYEFGLGHKTFEFDQPFQTEFNANNPNYWLAYWIYIHSFLLKTEWGKNVLLINYEDICSQAETRLKNLFKRLDIDLNVEPFATDIKLSRVHSLPNFDQRLVNSALTIERQLLQQSFR